MLNTSFSNKTQLKIKKIIEFFFIRWDPVQYISTEKMAGEGEAAWSCFR